MGLVMLGSRNAETINDMISVSHELVFEKAFYSLLKLVLFFQYAQETQHEKILRGLCVGLACVMYGRMEEADALIESLSRDKDPLMRRSGVYTLALAYCGTGNTEAVRRLLHVAVSDLLRLSVS